MPTANARKGAETERMVAKYFRDQGFWMAERRLREGRADDQGDIDGVPYTTVQVKYVESNRYQAWFLDTLKQRDTAGTSLCLLVRRIPRKPVEQWEAWMPTSQLADINAGDESEAWTWVHMDLRLAVAFIAKAMYLAIPSAPSWTTTAWNTVEGIEGPPSAPSTEKDTPPSPTT